VKAKELGNVAYKNKDFETALKHYEEALSHDPTNMTYISNQAGTVDDAVGHLVYSNSHWGGERIGLIWKNIKTSGGGSHQRRSHQQV